MRNSALWGLGGDVTLTPISYLGRVTLSWTTTSGVLCLGVCVCVCVCEVSLPPFPLSSNLPLTRLSTRKLNFASKEGTFNKLAHLPKLFYHNFIDNTFWSLTDLSK